VCNRAAGPVSRFDNQISKSMCTLTIGVSHTIEKELIEVEVRFIALTGLAGMITYHYTTTPKRSKRSSDL
jgi:hypothetical protein